jgi:hypothetical protein
MILETDWHSEEDLRWAAELLANSRESLGLDADA